MSTTNEANSTDKKSKGGVTEDDRSKSVDSNAPADARARGGVTEEDRSKSLGPEDTLKG